MAVLEAAKRSETGSRSARSLRAEGLVPAIIYGHGAEPVAVSLKHSDLDTAISHHQRLLELSVASEVVNVLIKDVQWDTFGQEVLHADFTRVDLDEMVRVTVPVVLRGTPAGAADDGVLQQTTAEVSIECMVRAIPEEIRVRVTDLNVGDSVLLKDIELPEGATLLDPPDARLCTVTIVAEVEEPAEEEVSSEPEVIGAEGEQEGEKTEE